MGEREKEDEGIEGRGGEERAGRRRAVHDRRERERGDREGGWRGEERAGPIEHAIDDRGNGKIGRGEEGRERGEKRTGGRRGTGVSPGPPSGGAWVKFDTRAEKEAKNDGAREGGGKEGRWAAGPVGLRVPS